MWINQCNWAVSKTKSYTSFLLLLVFHCPIFSTTEHCLPYSGQVEFSLEFNRLFAIIKYAWSISPFDRLSLNLILRGTSPTISQLLCNIDPRCLNHVNYGMIWSPIFTYKTLLTSVFTELAPHFLCPFSTHQFGQCHMKKACMKVLTQYICCAFRENHTCIWLEI